VTHLAAGDRFRTDGSPRDNGIFDTYQLPVSYVLYVGRLNPVKNLDVLLEAIAEARARYPSCPDLVVVGHKDDLYESLVIRANELNIARHVRFTGPIYEDLPAVYQNAFAFILPSSYEAFPQVPLEAMASGAPVIASNRGGIPEVVDDAGILVEPDPGAIADAIGRIISSPTLRDELRAKGFDRAKQFSWRSTARHTIDAYRQAMR
jgi:glycosyltransferase involved in cell wall biosynthesis